MIVNISGWRFLYDGGEIAAEIGSVGDIAERYVTGPGDDEPLVWYHGGGTTDRRYLHADERGSVIAVSDQDGSAIAINSYDEHGIPGATNVGRFQYTGQAWLPALGLYYYKARIYSPTLGRFLQTDPIGYGDGMNWYNYVSGDPVNKRDPSGLDENDACTTEGSGDCIINGKKEYEEYSLYGGGSWGFEGFFSALRMDFGFGGYDVGGGGGEASQSNGHKYVIERTSDCSADAVFNDLKRPNQSAPGAPAAREGFTPRVGLTGGNSISQTVSSSSRTIVNTTRPDHIFYPGDVTVHVSSSSNGGSQITITGTGTGDYAIINDIIGNIWFGTAANQSASVCHRAF